MFERIRIFLTSILIVSAAIIVLNIYASISVKDIADSVAVVNGEVISRQTLDDRFKPLLKQIEEQYSGKTDSEEYKKACEGQKTTLLEQLILEKIQMDKIKELNVDIDEKALASEASNLYESTKKQYNSDGKRTFDEYLSSRSLTPESYKSLLIMQMKLAKLMDYATKDLKADDNKAEEYYNANKYKFLAHPAKVHLAVMLVSSEDAAKQVKSRLDKGEDFSKLSKEFSIDAGSKDNGGDLGEMDYSSVDPSYVQAVFDTAAGKVTSPIKSSLGYYLVKVISKEAVEFESFAGIKDIVVNEMLVSQKKEAYSKILAKWREEAKVEILKEDEKEQS